MIAALVEYADVAYRWRPRRLIAEVVARYRSEALAGSGWMAERRARRKLTEGQRNKQRTKAGRVRATQATARRGKGPKPK